MLYIMPDVQHLTVSKLFVLFIWSVNCDGQFYKINEYVRHVVEESSRDLFWNLIVWNFYFLLSRKNLKKTLWPLFMNGVQLPQGYSHFEEAVYFLPFCSQKFLVLILSTSEGWKAESTLEPPSGFEHGTRGLGIQRLKH